jgi:hypothetical protein
LLGSKAQAFQASSPNPDIKRKANLKGRYHAFIQLFQFASVKPLAFKLSKFDVRRTF